MIKKLNLIKILILLIIILIPLLIMILNNKKEYYQSYNYFNNDIYIKIYGVKEKKATTIFNKINDIYNEYDILFSKTKYIANVNNLYYILNNNSNLEYIELDSKLYDLINYGKEVYQLTNGVIDISKGAVIDLWDSYLTTKYSIPSTDELNLINTFNIDDIKLEDNKIYNNNVNINLKYIINGYMNYIISNYLKENNINNYMINMGNSIIVGNNINDTKYSIGIEDPDNFNNIIDIVYANNISLSTVGGYQNNYNWNNKKYNYIVDSKTLTSSNNMKSITVITNNIKNSFVLSNYLYLMTIEDGKEFVNKTDDVEAIWYTNDNKIITSNNIANYLKQ